MLSKQYRDTEQYQAQTLQASTLHSASLCLSPLAQRAWYSIFVSTLAAIIALSIMVFGQDANAQNYDAVPNYAQPNQSAPVPANPRDLGWSCTTSAKAEQTVRLCSPLIRDPHSADHVRVFALLKRAKAWIVQNEYRAAANDYSMVIEMDPKHTNAISERAKMYEKTGEYRLAVQDYVRLIALDKKNASAYCKRGSVMKKLKDHKSAIKDYTMGLRIDPNRTDCLVGRGDVYAGLGQLEKALEEYSAAIAINKHDKDAYFQRGKLHKSLGEKQRAIADYLKVFKLDFFNHMAAQELFALGVQAPGQFE